MCKHVWNYLLPASSEMPESVKYKYFAAGLMRPVQKALVCAKCGLTGHCVYGRKVRVHSPEYSQIMREQAAERASEFGLQKTDGGYYLPPVEEKIICG